MACASLKPTNNTHLNYYKNVGRCQNTNNLVTLIEKPIDLGWEARCMASIKLSPYSYFLKLQITKPWSQSFPWYPCGHVHVKSPGEYVPPFLHGELNKWTMFKISLLHKYKTLAQIIKLIKAALGPNWPTLPELIPVPGFLPTRAQLFESRLTLVNQGFNFSCIKSAFHC